jgi:hypothetical protein
MKYELATDIAAPIERVWSLLIDVEDWPNRSRAFRKVTLVTPGSLGPGSVAQVTQPGLPTARWAVSRWDVGTRFDWESQAPGVHTVGRHTLARIDDEHTRLTLAIEQTGGLSDLASLTFGRRTRAYVQLEAAGLKKLAEGRPAV